MSQGVILEEPVQRTGTETIPLADHHDSENNSFSSLVIPEHPGSVAAWLPPSYAPALSDTPMSDNTELLIRVLDIVGATTILLLTAPVMLIVAALIKVLSPGPVLYKQKRVGRHGRIFTIYKFRTMINGAEKHTGPILAEKNDSRTIPIGSFLRQTRLDELPQLFNVLKGQMSLVGPRPERPYFVRQHRALQGIRLMVKPGLTGLAQVRSHYHLKPRHKIKYDYLYIQKRCLVLNIYILLQTIPVVFLKRGF